ncbi:pimeloyl-ACP methyl ester carboxylesterase [Streptacidiphilus sp. MAP12-33]|uniref:hypothetical protein n=1 Tax=Streptacidiphilus sp. MAP12-33 TaxID=3156266 RepID=UPI003517A3D5
MTRRARARSVVASALLLALCAACAAGGASPGAGSAPTVTVLSAPATAAALDGCVTADAFGPGVPIATLVVHGPSAALPVAVLGRGRRTVVMSNQSDRVLCAWLPLARRLTGEGYRVLLWDYAGAPPADELRAVVAAARAGGAGPVVLLGASKGAKTSIVAAAGTGPAVAGVVSLSAEETLLPDVAVAQYVPRLPCPLLLLTAADDAYGSAAAAQRFDAVARPGTARVLTLPGTAHGVDLLTGPTAAASLTAVDGFLRRTLGPA